MSQCGDYEDINFYVINELYGIVIAVYILPLKNHPVVSGGSGTAFSTYIRTAPGGSGVRSLRHVLDDAGKTVDCLRHVLFDVVAGTVFSTFSLVLGGSRTIFSMSAVIPGSGRARDSLHSQHVNSDAKRAGDSFQQHHGYRIPWIASTPFCVGTGPRQLPLVQYLFVKHHVFSRADSNVRDSFCLS